MKKRISELATTKKKKVKKKNAHFSVLLAIVPSPSNGIPVIFLNLTPYAYSNSSSAWIVMLTNFEDVPVG